MIDRRTGGFSQKAIQALSIDRKNKVVLDYILSHHKDDRRPYLNVEIFGRKYLGLLDSGANRTLMNLNLLDSLGKLGVRVDRSSAVKCTVANGQKCETLGTVEIPLCLEGKVKLMKVLVMPDLKHSLILGLDFWREMKIIPNLNNNQWQFMEDSEKECQLASLVGAADLDGNQSDRLRHLVNSTFRKMGDGIGCTNIVRHKIETDSPPIKQRSYRVNPIMQGRIDKEVEQMLKEGIIERSDSPWSSPVLMVPKKDGSYRFCVDFRQLNKVTRRDAYPLPFMDSILDRLGNSRYLSSLDIKSAYWQIEIDESSRQYTAFSIPGRGHFQFRRLPFGLHNAPATWQRLIDNVLGPELEPYVFVYLDDVIITTPDFETHVKVLSEVFNRLTSAGLTLSRDKCKFCLAELRYLGMIVNRDGINVDPEKVSAILNLKPPSSVKEVRSLLGMVSWYRRFIPDLSTLIAPVAALLKKRTPFSWSEECEKSFRDLKNLLISAPVLSSPRFDLPFTLQTDASGYGLGGVLTQYHPDGEKVVCYVSRSLTRQERAYSTTERECLAVIWAIEKLRPYLEGTKFTVITDHYSLLWLNKIKDVSGRLTRWSLRLQAWDFDILHRKGRDIVVPDLLSRSVPVTDEVNVSICMSSDDKWYNKMLELVENSPLKYPKFRVESNRLYKYIPTTFASFENDEYAWKEIVPKDRRLQVIKNLHDNPTSGHTGTFKTFHRVRQQYYWPKMRHDITKYVKNCHTCSQYKGEPRKGYGYMSRRPMPDKPWQVISLDLQGPFPRSSQGYTYILVVFDELSKFPMTFPLRSATTKSIVKQVEDYVFLLFGTPAAIIVDNGSQLRGNVFTKFCKEYGVEIWFNALYHPQANPTERINRTIKTMLASFVGDNHRNWCSYLPKITCAIRTSVQETTKQTPYFVNFGREHIIDGRKHKFLSRAASSEHTEPCRVKAFQELYADIKKRLEKSFLRSKERYDLRKRPIEYSESDLVWLKNYVQSDASRYFTSKLAPKFVGPYRIKKRKSYLTYELVDDYGTSKGVWHVKDLKPYSSGSSME